MIRIVKGQPDYPQSQGSVECGNASFKEAMAKSMADPDTTSVSWAKFGVL